MKRFIEGLDRSQTTLLPECIDDYVDEDSPVRAVDAFIDMLDLAALGFELEFDPATVRFSGLDITPAGLAWETFEASEVEPGRLIVGSPSNSAVVVSVGFSPRVARVQARADALEHDSHGV